MTTALSRNQLIFRPFDLFCFLLPDLFSFDYQRYTLGLFTKGDSNKDKTEQELAAIHRALNHFRSYIYEKRNKN